MTAGRKAWCAATAAVTLVWAGVVVARPREETALKQAGQVQGSRTTATDEPSAPSTSGPDRPTSSTAGASTSTSAPAGHDSTTPTTTPSTTTTTPSPDTTTTTTPPPSRDPSAMLARLRVDPEAPRAGYDRDLFPHWVDADGDRCDTREEVLVAESATPAQVDPHGCVVVAGDWFSTYDGVTTDQPGDLDIDHVVASPKPGTPGLPGGTRTGGGTSPTTSATAAR